MNATASIASTTVGMLIVLILLVLLVVGASVSPTRNARVRIQPPRPPASQEPVDLAISNPVEALLLYGTPDDAARLGDAGVDLTGLGYQPPAHGG